MHARLDLIGIVVADMPRSLAFYRQLGLDIPAEADGEGHVEVTLPGGLRLAWDTEEVIRSFDPDWTPPSGSPHGPGLPAGYPGRGRPCLRRAGGARP